MSVRIYLTLTYKGKTIMKKNVIKKSGDSKKPSSKTSTATKTATETKTSTDAYTQGNIIVTGGAGKGATNVKIGLPGGSLANNSKKAIKAKGKK